MSAALNSASVDAVVVQVRRGATHLSRRLRLERRGETMSPGKVAILGHLARTGSMTPGQLAQAEFLQPQSLTRVLSDLSHAGLITRIADPADGRQSLINVTPAGRKALMHDMRSRDEWLQQAMLALTEAERDLLGVAAALMERMADGN